MELVLPDVKYKDSFIEAVKEFQTDKSQNSRTDWYDTLQMDVLSGDFDAFVARENSHARGENLREGYVPYTVYWLVDNETFIGKADVRHRLSDRLAHVGGHIGYDIRPSERGRGYGNTILALTLEKAKELGISKVFITADVDNIRSQKVIEKNGGVLQDKVLDEVTGVEKMRYWISIA